MADRPILFSASMVRALLDRRKTQTRRVLKPQPRETPTGMFHVHGAGGGGICLERDIPTFAVDYIKHAVGDRLWVREDFCFDECLDKVAPRDLVAGIAIMYLADGATTSNPGWEPMLVKGRRRASMHMPRWASRLTLVVTDVRVQRLQEIDLRDARAEECRIRNFDLFGANSDERNSIGRGAYRLVWEDINGPGSWEANPWVAAYTFSVHPYNIDRLEAAPCPAA